MPLLLSLSLTRSLSKHVCRAVKKGQSEMLLCGGGKGGWRTTCWSGKHSSKRQMLCWKSRRKLFHITTNRSRLTRYSLTLSLASRISNKSVIGTMNGFDHFFLAAPAFRIIAAHFVASASDSNPKTAEYFLPITWATRKSMLIPAPAMACAVA
jgi:hypothetical protein